MQANGRRSRAAIGLPKLNKLYLASLPKILISLELGEPIAKESLVDTWSSGQITNALPVTATLPSVPPTSIESVHGPVTPDFSQLPSPALRSILAEKGQEEAPLPNQGTSIGLDGSCQGLSEPVSILTSIVKEASPPFEVVLDQAPILRSFSPPTSIEFLHGPVAPDFSQLPSPALRSILAEKGQEEAPLPNQGTSIGLDASSQGLSEPVFTASSPSRKVIETLTVSQLASCRASCAFQEKLMVRQLDTDSTTLEFTNRVRVIYIISDVRGFLSSPSMVLGTLN